MPATYTFFYIYKNGFHKNLLSIFPIPDEPEPKIKISLASTFEP
jgi:hypothetical protein